MWFDELQQKFEDLDHGIVSPVFDCAARSNALPTNVWEERRLQPPRWRRFTCLALSTKTLLVEFLIR